MSARQELLDRVVAWFVDNGIGDTSLRTLAAALGSSHRMLIYHFGNREGMLGAVIEEVERRERVALDHLLHLHDDPEQVIAAFWNHITATATTFGPLFFELTGHAMQGKPWAAPLRDLLATGWIDALTELSRRSGEDPMAAQRTARLTLAMARGLLFELSLTGDRATADATLADFRERMTGPAQR